MEDQKHFIVLVAGFSNYHWNYPVYEEKFGIENFAHTTNAKRYTVDEHLEEIESILPENRPYLLVGYSMGVSLIIELMNRKVLSNCKGATLIGGSRYQPTHWFLNFVFSLPAPFIYFFAFLILLSYPIALMINKFSIKNTNHTCVEGLMRLIENKASEMRKEYNQCIRKVGINVKGVLEENKDIPIYIIRLQKDLMVDEKDLEYTKTFFTEVKEKILPANIIHLTHAQDNEFVKMIEEEYEFFNIV